MPNKKKNTNNLTLAFLIGFVCCVLVMPKKREPVENTINTVGLRRVLNLG